MISMTYKVLVVEDDQDIAKMYKEMLKIIDQDVDIARNAAEAMWMSDDTAYDLLLLDICMPLKSGMFVIEYLKKKEKMPKIIVISAISLICQPEYYAIKKSADIFLQKPITIETLLEAVQKLLP